MEIILSYAKGEALTTKMCQSNVKLWQEPTNWESEPAPDWVSAQDVDYSDPTASTTSKVKRSKKSVASSAEPWIKPPVHGDESSSDEDYEGEPPVKNAEDLKVPLSQRKREPSVKKPDDLNVPLSQRLSKKRVISDDAESLPKEFVLQMNPCLKKLFSLSLLLLILLRMQLKRKLKRSGVWLNRE